MRIFRNLSELPEFKNAVLTIGSFDGVHTGHQKIIEQVRQIAQEKKGESVLITFHPHPRLVLAPDSSQLRLLSTIEEKVELLEKFGVDNVVIVPFTQAFHQQSPEAYIRHFLIEKFRPAALVIGYDHRFGRDRAGNIDYLRRFTEEGNFEIIEIRKQEVADIAVSSTKVRQSLARGDVKTAAQLLNHTFTLSGKVIHGQHIGKTLGFPTANIQTDDPHKLIPPTGIYAVYAWHQDKRYGAMLYIGNRPTLKEHHNRTIEVNILDFDRDIYGDTLRIEFLDHIREDQSFQGLEALRLQLIEDEKSTRAILGMEKKSQ